MIYKIEVIVLNFKLSEKHNPIQWQFVTQVL